MFYAFCPAQDLHHCTDGDRLEFEAELTPRTFDYDGLIRIGDEHAELVDPDASEHDR